MLERMKTNCQKLLAPIALRLLEKEKQREHSPIPCGYPPHVNKVLASVLTSADDVTHEPHVSLYASPASGFGQAVKQNPEKNIMQTRFQNSDPSKNNSMHKTKFSKVGFLLGTAL